VHIKGTFMYPSHWRVSTSLLNFRLCTFLMNATIFLSHSGAMLLGGGVYTFLDRLFPATMVM